jgi:hypothetical protein
MDVRKLLNHVRTPSPTGAAGGTDAMGATHPAAQAAPRHSPRGEQFAELAGGTPPRVQSGARAPRGMGPARSPEMSSQTGEAGVTPGGDEPGQSSAAGPVRRPPRGALKFFPYMVAPGAPAGGTGLGEQAPVEAHQWMPTAVYQGGLRPSPGAVAASGPAFLGQVDTNPFGLTDALRDRIGRTRGGAMTLAFLAYNHEALLGSLPQEDIVHIAIHESAAQALQAVLDLGPALRAAGFTSDDIVRIAANTGGAPALQAVLAFLAEPDAKDFAIADIVRVAAHEGGSPAVRAVLELGPALRAAGFTNDDLVEIAANTGAAGTLRTVLNLAPALRAANFTNKDIVRIAANIGGAQALRVVLAFLAEPAAADFEIEDIVRMTAHNGGGPALEAVRDHLDMLRNRGYSDEQIVEAGSMRRGASGHVAELARSRR